MSRTDQFEKLFTPIKLTNEELDKAFKIWYRKYQSKTLDKNISEVIDYQLQSSTDSKSYIDKNWLQSVRQALFLSTNAVAEKLNISQAAYSKFEIGEKNETISIGTLSKAAQAMDCELVYFMRPKNKKYFSEIIWNQLLSFSITHPWIKSCDPKKRAEALAFIAGRNTTDSKVRKQLGWSQKSNYV